MNRFIIAAAMLPMVASGQESGQGVPSYLVGGALTSTTNDGITYDFPSDTHKIVDREKSRAYHAKIQAKIKALQDEIKRLEGLASKEPDEPKTQRLIFHGGYGPYQMVTQRFADQVTGQGGVDAWTYKGPVVGLSYQHQVLDGITFVGTILTNKTYLGGVGIGW